MIGAAKGYSVKLAMPANVSRERKAILAAYGASVVYTDPGELSDGAILEARRIYEADPERYFKPDQYNNPSNWHAHRDTTAPEIWEQTGGRVTHFIATIGTSGTVMGTGRGLKAFNPAVEVIAAEPAEAQEQRQRKCSQAPARTGESTALRIRESRGKSGNQGVWYHYCTICPYPPIHNLCMFYV